VLSSISWTKLRSDVLTAMLGRGGVMIVGFITTLLLTRILPISDVGVYFIVLSVVLILGPLANLGLQEPTVRAIASLVATDDHARASGVAKCALRVAVTSAGIASITVLLTWTALAESELFLAKENLLTGVFVAAWIGTIAVEAQLVGKDRTFRSFRRSGCQAACCIGYWSAVSLPRQCQPARSLIRFRCERDR